MAPFETVITPRIVDKSLFEKCDDLDYPVPYSASIGSLCEQIAAILRPFEIKA